MKTPNQRTIVSDIQTLPGMDSRDILVPAGSAMPRYDSRGFPAPASTQVQHFGF
ncbi:MAG: hypothetical protein SVK44_02875 [Nitrospirota bacterium]|nr:hypothetical protein [Nitrospirota bacterium]